MRRLLFCAVLLLLLSAPAAWARDPITPLSDVHRGLHCTGRTVVQGTTISDFDVDVLDVVADQDGTGARILVRVSGPAVDATGIASGFSGSPVYCPDAHGVIGNAGAISATIGQYGEDVGLVTPIEQMLALPVTPPSGVRRAPRLLRAARPLASPLVLSGLSPQLGSLLERTALAHHRVLVAAPAGPLGTFPPQQLVPGASLAVGLSTGAVGAGAIGTVTYRDGDVVYGFGHPLEGAGRRALLLQDAYVFTVVGNPLDVGAASSYKLAAPGHTVGTLTNDALTGVVGTVGAAPRTVPLTVRVTDADTGARTVQRTSIVDEVDLGDPDGANLLSAIASVGVAQAVTSTFGGAPAQQTGRFCMTIRLRELRRPLHSCRRHVVQLPIDPALPPPLAAAMAGDLGSALDVIDHARFRALHLTRIDASATIERGLRLASIVGAHVAHRTVRPGQRVGVALRVRLFRGPLRTLRCALRVPREVRPGVRLLRIEGTPVEGLDSGGGFLALLEELFGGGSSSGAQSMDDVLASFALLSRWDGVFAQLRGQQPEHLCRSPKVRIDGRTLLALKVGRARRRVHHRAVGRILETRG
ncbi:MAG: hypothetical protein JSS99_16110 [Actinobacteria bacterium]|nr:hypothetical protein [Actinomycetota bacterium]